MPDPGLAGRLRQRAAEIGLDAVGIAPVGPSAHGAALRAWLERGHAGAMTWMERTAKDSVDLTRRFPWARTAVVVAQPHLSYRGDRRAQPGLLPYVARYAVGADYHDTLFGRLEALETFLHAEAPGATTRSYVDTGPILERELAVRAGLGWFGKSTNLIRPRGPSWVLLGEILTSLDLTPDAPVADRCGTCTACIDDCPTGAILEPYVVDSNRCISYLTIELEGRLPEGDPHAAIGDWIFGCDICQEVCPWNRKAEPVDDAPFLPAPALTETRLANLIRIDQPTFESRFAGTALLRPGRQGLVRNALIVASHTADAEALDAARGALSDDDPLIRATAARALDESRD